MTKISSCLIAFLLFYCQEYLVAAQMIESHGKQSTTSFTRRNESEFHGRIHDNRARLLYYVYRAGFDFSGKECAKKYDDYTSNRMSHLVMDDCGDLFFNWINSCELNYSTGMESLDLISVDLTNKTNDEDNFVVPILNENASFFDVTRPSPQNYISNIAITSNGPQLDTFYTRGNFDFVQRTRTSYARGSNITRKVKANRIVTPVVDWVTSNVYYISNSRIMVCDPNLVFCCALPNKTVTKAFLLTISPERRLLFSVVQSPKLEPHQLLRHSLDNCLETLSLHTFSRNPNWITVDSALEQLYWFDMSDHNELFLYSSNFEGKNLKKMQPGKHMLDDFVPFAVFNNIMYWLPINQKFIMYCRVDNCIKSTSSLTQVPRNIRYPLRSEYGYPIIEYRSSNSINHTDLCDSSSCSHLCLPESETEYRCYCQHSEDPISLSDKNNGFCEDHTVLAAYKNILYVVGLPDDDFSSPKIREHKINISSIAAIIYDSINGNVILTEVGKQKIYLWLPRTKELKLISDEGHGTINSLAFDHYANNLYWIDPGVQFIKALNLRTGRKVNILKGNSSCIPKRFVLIPSTGYIAVLLMRKNSLITIEYGISMDGISDTQQVLLEDKEIIVNVPVEDLSLYYWKENRTICLLDRGANTIRYFPIDGSPELQPSRKENGTGKIESLAFLKNSIVWSEEDLVIQKAQVRLEDLLVSRPRVPRISLVRPSATDLDNAKNGVFKLFGIERQNEIPGYAAKCLQNNGGCQEPEMCLISSGYLQVSCVCPEGGSSMSNISCGSYIISYKPVEYQSTTNLNSAADIYHFWLIVTFLTLASFIGYLSLPFISYVKKRIDRYSKQSEDSISISYWNTGSQDLLSYPCDHEC